MEQTTPLKALRAYRDQFPTQQAAAEALGITPTYFSDLLRGRRTCSPKLLARLGLKQIVVKR